MALENLMPLPKISGVERNGYDPVSWQDPCSPLVYVKGDEIRQATGVTDKRELVREARDNGGLLLMPWVGRWSTTVFEVDDHERALDGLMSRGGQVR